MKILKRVALTLVVLVALLLLAALFVERDYAVERVIVINKPKQEVFDYIKFVKNQDHFSKWNMMDPKMVKTYKGVDGQVGFVYSWNSKNKDLGIGSQEISKIVEGERLETKLHFIEPMDSEDDAYFATEAIDSSSTKVRWGFKGELPYPFNILRLTMDLDKMIGADLETGLSNLKTVLEKK